MKKKIWIKDINGIYRSYPKPITIGQELEILSELSAIELSYETLPKVMTTVASIILDLPPEKVEELFTGDTLMKIFSSVREDLAQEVKLPYKKSTAGRKQQKEEPKTYKQQIMDLVSFLLYYSNLTLNEILNSPKQVLIDIYMGLLEFIELERDFEFQISAVSALSALSGGSKGTNKSERQFDLTTDEGLEAIMSIPGLVEVK